MVLVTGIDTRVGQEICKTQVTLRRRSISGFFELFTVLEMGQRMHLRRPIAALIAGLFSSLPVLSFAAAPTIRTPFDSHVTLVPATTTSQKCANLTTLRLPHATVTLAQLVAGGSFTPPGSAAGSQPITGLPEFCRVAGFSAPTSDSHIGFEVWIPTGARWNLKYQQVGNGGFAGAIPYGSLAAGIAYGYASAGTDDGHIGMNVFDASWALGHPQKIVDFGYRALKETTDKSKAIISAFTGMHPQRSYFDGCSDGGREALMEAERFPNDFDGIIAGSPANFWTRLLTAAIYEDQALLDAPANYIPPAKLPILTAGALGLCAGRDGGLNTDGFLNDPRSCAFNARLVECKPGQNTNTCLTSAQATVANRIYGGLRNSITQAQSFPGLEPGGEAIPADWPAWVTGPTPYNSYAFYFGQQYFANFIFNNPAWPIQGLDTNDVGRSDVLAPTLNSTNPNLSRFFGHGGKLIHYVGWSDSAIPPKNTLNYYNSVLLSGYGANGLARLQQSYRLYMVPGMAHCSGGVGANEFGNDGPRAFSKDPAHDIVLALDNWVERGVAPNRIIATKYVNDDPGQGIAFQRPLCVYPLVSKYVSGSPRSAGSFACVTNDALFATDLKRTTQYMTQNSGVLYNPRE